MSSLRKKYKAKTVSIADMKAKADSEDHVLGNRGGEDYLEIEQGKSNKFRFFPPHDGPDFFIMRKRYWMEIPDENDTPKKRTVNDSIVHGGTKLDIVQEYINFATKTIDDKDKIATLTDWKTGLKATTDWVSYALKISGGERKFGLLSFKKQVRDQLNKLMFTEDEDDPIEVDPFTDIDDGYPVIITLEKKKKGKKEETVYGVTLSKKSDQLSDEELEVYEEVKPLNVLYRNNYGLKDFEKALEGLRYFDMENEFEIFDEDAWVDICEKVKSQYSDDDEEDEDEDEDEKPKKKSSKKVAKKVVDEDDDEDEEEEEEEPAPKKQKPKAKKVVVEDDEEDEDEDDDEEEDEEEEVPAPKKSKAKKVVVEDDDEEEEAPRKRMSLSDVRKKLGKK